MDTKSKMNDKTDRANWLEDPDILIFSGDEDIPIGASRQHALSDRIGDLFGLRKEDVQQNWERVLGQINFLLEKGVAISENFELSEVKFELGFSAEGQIVFVAKTGINTTISVLFRRKSAISGS